MESQFSHSSHHRFAQNAVNSQSSIQCAEDYGVSSNPVLLANKLKNSYNLHSDDGSLNNLESRNDGSKKFIAVSKSNRHPPKAAMTNLTTHIAIAVQNNNKDIKDALGKSISVTDDNKGVE